ncbi:MAG TPA: anti-sigma factor [Candidatus Acidoferrum sp.]|nr:anti-sigma factor [Candidatus Acidoferrum sp.]
MSCEHASAILHGYLDGELDAARASEFERHLESCPECLAALEAQETLRGALQRAQLYEPAPVALRRKIRANLPAARPVGFSLRWTPMRWLALAAAALLLAFVGWRILPGLNREGEYQAAELIDAHLRSLQAGHLTDVTSTDQHTVKPWFDGKLDFAPPVRDFANDGFPLQGGRLDVLRGRAVAALVYGRRKHIVNVFVWPSSEPDVAPREGSKLGYQWMAWRKGGMEFCAVSDTSAADLEQLQRLISQ